MSFISSILGLFPSFIPGERLVDGGELQQLASLVFSSQTGITAAAGGGQTNATPVSAAFNRVDTVASANDSIRLPQAIPGLSLKVKNNTATTLAVFGIPNNPVTGAGDTIAASGSNTQQPTATGTTIATGVTAEIDCYVAGQWQIA